MTDFDAVISKELFDSSEFLKAHVDHPLQRTVNYRSVPTFNGLALAMHDAELHGAPHFIFSSDRRDAVIRNFNAEYHTHLHGQQWLIDAYARDPHTYYPANPVDETSHCLFSDGNPAYKKPARARIPWYMLGIDAQDHIPGAKYNDCSHLVATLGHLGYRVTRPYHSGSEAHHFIFIEHPLHNLRRRGIVK